MQILDIRGLRATELVCGLLLRGTAVASGGRRSGPWTCHACAFIHSCEYLKGRELIDSRQTNLVLRRDFGELETRRPPIPKQCLKVGHV